MPGTKHHHARITARPLISIIVVLLALIFFLIFAASYKIPETIDGVGLILFKGGLAQILSPQEGVIDYYVKSEGELIKKGDIIAYIKSHDEHDNKKPIIAHVDGMIAEIVAYPDTTVLKGQAVAIISHKGDPYTDLEVIGFVSSLEGKKVVAGMTAHIAPSIVDPQNFGMVVGHVNSVGKLPMSKAAVQSVIKIPEVAHYIREQIQAEPFVVKLSLHPDTYNITGYAWTGPGPSFPLDSGIIAEFAIIVSDKSLLARLLPSLFRRSRGA